MIPFTSHRYPAGRASVHFWTVLASHAQDMAIPTLEDPGWWHHVVPTDWALKLTGKHVIVVCEAKHI